MTTTQTIKVLILTTLLSVSAFAQIPVTPPGGGGGGGSVTTVSVTTANGISGTVANPTSTPAISLTLGAITPTSVNGATITNSTGTTTAGLNIGTGTSSTPSSGTVYIAPGVGQSGTSTNSVIIGNGAGDTTGTNSNQILIGQGVVSSSNNTVIIGNTSISTTTLQGRVSAPAIMSSGTKFAATGCATTTPLGGASAGSFVSGTTGTCTVVITLGGGTVAANNGWACHANDITTPADTIQQTAFTTTTVTLNGTTVTGDIINFACTGY